MTTGDQATGTPSPDALIPALDDRQLSALREVGREWDQVSDDPGAWRRALPLDPELGRYPAAAEIQPTTFGRFVPLAGRDGQLPVVETTSQAEAPPTGLGRIAYRARRVLLGPPLSATAIATERMRKLVALPVLSSDALFVGRLRARGDARGPGPGRPVPGWATRCRSRRPSRC